MHVIASNLLRGNPQISSLRTQQSNPFQSKAEFDIYDVATTAMENEDNGSVSEHIVDESDEREKRERDEGKEGKG